MISSEALDHPAAPLFDSSTIRHALEGLRQATSPIGASLRNLVWVRQRIEAHGPAVSSVGLDVALSEALTDLIEESFVHLRDLENLAAPRQDDNRESLLDAFRADFSRGNIELEAWSALYHRYVRIDLSLQIQEMARLLGLPERQFRRRLEHGVRRLTHEVSRRESKARAANWRLWLRLKLPPSSLLVGMDDDLAALCASLTSPPPHVVILSGAGGSGKTTLARAAAGLLIDDSRFADFAWLSLDVSTAYRTLLILMARTLGYPHLAEAEQADLEAGLRLRLADVPTLLVLDNADYLENYSALLPALSDLAAPGCVLLTARTLPSADAPVHLHPIRPLPHEDMARLLREYARLRRFPQTDLLDEAAVDVIYAAVGGNPLAGRLIVGQLAHLPLNHVLNNLSRLPTPSGEGLLDALYGEAWRGLGESARQTAFAFTLLPAEGAGWDELLVASDLPPEELDGALSALASRSLIEITEPHPHYMIHPLTRRFVENEAARPHHRVQYRRVLDAAVLREQQVEYPIDSAERASHALALIERGAALSDRLDALAELIAHVAPAIHRSGQWLAWRKVLLSIASHFRQSANNPTALAQSMHELGVASRWLGDSAAARSAFGEAIRLFGETGDFIGQAEALIDAGQLEEALGHSAEAYAAYQQAAGAVRRYNASELHRRVLLGLAGLALADGRSGEALDLLEQTLASFEGGPPDGQTLSQLGMAYLQTGQTDRAINAGQDAVAWFQQEGDLPRLARAHLRLGMAFDAAGNHDEALAQLQAGLSIMRALGDALGQARLLNNLGAVYVKDRRLDEALAVWRDAFQLQGRLGDRVGMAYTLYNLADLQWKLDRAESARAALQEARVLAEELGLVTLLAHINGHPAV